MSSVQESPVELRCAVAVVRRDAVLLLQRHAREETGLEVHPKRCGLVLEVNDPIARRRIKGLTLRPPIGGFLPELARREGAYGRYLGNMWRPQRGDP